MRQNLDFKAHKLDFLRVREVSVRLMYDAQRNSLVYGLQGGTLWNFQHLVNLIHKLCF